MISAFDIYLISEFDNICALLVATVGISIIATISFIFCYFLFSDGYQDDQDKKNIILCKKMGFISFWIFVISFFLTALIPSSKTVASMIIIPPVVNAVSQNKQIQQIPQAVLDLIKSYENNDSKKQK